MAGIVTERWSERRFARGKSAQRVFEVNAGPANESEAQAEVLAQTGVNYGSTFSLDPSLTVPSRGIDVQPIVPGFYRVTAAYEANATSGDTSGLFGKKWQVLPTEIIFAELDADSTYEGHPITDSCRQPVENPPGRTVAYYRFRLRRYELGTDLLTKNLAYQNKWNNDAVTLPRYGTAGIKELKIISIGQVDAQEQGASTGVLVEYVIEAKPTRSVRFKSASPSVIHGWHTRILDMGMQVARMNGPTDYLIGVPYRKNSTEHITEPIMLDGEGWPLFPDLYTVLKSDDNTIATKKGLSAPPGCTLESLPVGSATPTAVFLNWDTTEGPIAFSGLNISANN